MIRRLWLLALCGCSSFSVGLYDEEAVLRKHPALRGAVVPAPDYTPGKSEAPPETWITSDDRRLAIGEKVRISIPDNPDLGRTLPVGPDGTLDLPRAGRIRFAGRTIGEIRRDLEAHYAKGIQNPRVELAVAEGRFINTVGMINFEGKLTLEYAKDLQTALHMAGGLSRLACLPQILVVRPSERKVVVCDYYAFQKDKDARQNPALREGDVVVVPENYPESESCAAEWAAIERFIAGTLDREGLLKALKR